MFGGLIGILVMFACTPAPAQSACEFRKSLMAKLNTGYNERPIGIGVASTGNVVELIVSPDGTWTIMVTKPDGIACIAAVGEDWQAIEPTSLDESS